MKDNKDKISEKDRLMEEVLNKKRNWTFDAVDAKGYLEGKTRTLKNADDALSDLNKILLQQQQELEKMAAQLGTTDDQMEKLQKEIERDYGVKMVEDKPGKHNLSKEFFDNILEQLKTKTLGQDEALTKLVNGFRRPYVMKQEKISPFNTILISGPDGSGRHSSVMNFARAMYEKQEFISDEVYMIDMSRYSSSSQESLFLQDMFTALKGKGSIIVIEHYEEGFAPYLRMLNSLVCEGRMQLNKRYVEQKGQLIESQSGLIQGAIDSLTADYKYLVFITEEKPNKAIDAFGADFLLHVVDIIIFEKLSDEVYDKVFDLRVKDLQEKCKRNLGLEVIVEDELKKHMLSHLNKQIGAESVRDKIDEYYAALSELVLSQNVKDTVTLTYKDKPVIIYGEQQADLEKQDNKESELAAINAELDEVVGLEEVKNYIRSLESHLKMMERRKAQGMKVAEVSKHMIFTGNPGTGKTTIARLISRYMKAIGALSQGQLVEVTRADLVGQYVGHTAPLTMSVIKSAIGGVLFVDEAYALHRGHDDSFGLEAIDTLVKAMEDYRDDLVVILAGYSKEMSVFLEANSGLKSRFPNVIHFKDYTGEELMLIAKSIAKGKEYKIDEGALKPLQDYFTEQQMLNARENGNGRMARNLVEEAILRQSERVLKDENAAIDVLMLEDFDLGKHVEE